MLTFTRGKTWIINLPGSKKAATENLLAVIGAVSHGLDMLHSLGSLDCAAENDRPSLNAWITEAKSDPLSSKCGMYLFHQGVVRESSKKTVYLNKNINRFVTALKFSYDKDRVKAAINTAKTLPGIYYVRVWLNSGTLSIGEDLMLVLVGGDIHSHVVDALQFLVKNIKKQCVSEIEVFEDDL